MNILFQTEEGGEWRVWACALSGRIQFDSYEAAWKARWLVRTGKALRARAVQVGEQDVVTYAEFERRGLETVQLSGPDL